MSTIVGDVFELYEPLAEDAGVKLVLGTMDQNPVKANRELVGQTISNLVDNAIKYAGGGENPVEVTLSVEKEDGKVKVDGRGQRAGNTGRPGDARDGTVCASGGKPLAAGLRARPQSCQGRYEIARWHIGVD